MVVAVVGVEREPKFHRDTRAVASIREQVVREVDHHAQIDMVVRGVEKATTLHPQQLTIKNTMATRLIQRIEIEVDQDCAQGQDKGFKF